MASAFEIAVAATTSVKQLDELILEFRKLSEFDTSTQLNVAFDKRKELVNLITKKFLIPEVAYVDPYDDKTKIDPAITFIYVSFNQIMDQTTAEAAFSLTGASSGAVSGALTWSNSDKTLTFTFSNLTADDEYTLIIAETAESSSGHTMARSFESTFKTA